MWARLVVAWQVQVGDGCARATALQELRHGVPAEAQHAMQPQDRCAAEAGFGAQHLMVGHLLGTMRGPSKASVSCACNRSKASGAPVRLVRLSLGDARERVLRHRVELRVAPAGRVVVCVRQVCTAGLTVRPWDNPKPQPYSADARSARRAGPQ